MKTPPICVQCGGKCCKQMPGIYCPDDLQPITAAKIARMIAKGVACVDSWEGEIRPGAPENALFLRGRTTTDRGPYTASWGGRCAQLTPTGCAMKRKDRPRVCRELQPGATLDDDCFVPERLSKENCVVAWLPFQDALAEAAHW